MKKLILLVVAAVLFIAFLPELTSAASGYMGIELDSATAGLTSLAPKMAALALGVAVVAGFVGMILHAFGHGHGKKMIKGAILVAVLALAWSAFMAWLSKEGSTAGTHLMATAGDLFNALFSHLP